MKRCVKAVQLVFQLQDHGYWFERQPCDVILHPSGEDKHVWGSKAKTWLGLLDMYIYHVQFKWQAFTRRNTVVLYTVGSTSTSASPWLPMQGPLVSALPLHTDAMLVLLYCCLIWFRNGLDGVSVAWKCYSICLCVDGEWGRHLFGLSMMLPRQLNWPSFIGCLLTGCWRQPTWL